MVRFLQPKDVASVLQQSMLVSAARAQEGNGVSSSKFNRPERSFGAAVRTSRHAPDAVELFQLLQVAWNDAFGWQPCGSDGVRMGLPCENEAFVNRAMRRDFRTEIADQ